MSGLNKTGPNSEGPLSGRGLGTCTNNDEVVDQSGFGRRQRQGGQRCRFQGGNRGRGLGQGRGQGRGLGRNRGGGRR